MADIGKQRRLMQGNEAIAEAAIRAGVRFFAGYPITPATEIAEYMARNLPGNGGAFIQMEDEIGSMAAVVGASLCGKKSMTASSGPGISLKQENIGMAAMQEVPCVIVNVMRVGPCTGMATMPAQQDVMQARWGSHGDRGAIALCPSTVQECFDLTVRAVNLSEQYRTPVYLLSDAEVGHMREVIELPDTVPMIERSRPTVPPQDYVPYFAEPDGVSEMADFGTGYLWHAEGSTHNVRGDLAATDHASAAKLHKRLIDKIDMHRDEIADYAEEGLEGAEFAVVSYGITARAAQAAARLAREGGIRCGFLGLRTLWPFAEERIRERLHGVKGVLVAELNQGQMLLEIERALDGTASVAHIGRIDGIILTPEEIYDKIKEMSV